MEYRWSILREWYCGIVRHTWCGDWQVAEREAAKILKRCDHNDDGVVDEEEFERYYLQTTEVTRVGGV